MMLPRMLERPFSMRQSLALGGVLVGGGALYCTAYTLFQGEWENPLSGAGWALVNLLPWLAAFELGKRAKRGAGTPAAAWRTIGAILLAAGLISLAGGLLLEGPFAPAFEIVRRLPAMALVAGLLALAPGRRGEGPPVDEEGLAWLPAQIDWIRSAGNYVEIRARGHVVLRRMTMRRAEALFSGDGFVRIHRTMLVNAARIEALRRGKAFDEVRVDGTWLKVGGAYRHLFRHFVPRS